MFYLHYENYLTEIYHFHSLQLSAKSGSLQPQNILVVQAKNEKLAFSVHNREYTAISNTYSNLCNIRNTFAAN